MSTAKRSPVTAFSRVRSLHPEYIDLRPISEQFIRNHSYETPQTSSLSISLSTTSQGESHERLLKDQRDGFPWHGERGAFMNTSLNITSKKTSDTHWPLGMKLALFLVAIILVLNSAITLWASTTYVLDEGIGTLYHGQCEKVIRIGEGIHVFINVVGTLLLGASNFTMQCLSSPTRKEVDSGHAKKLWLEIGVLSLRNLKFISRIRLWLWIGLALSSVPIHLMYNSAVFVNLTANKYMVAAVTESFVNGGNWTLPPDDTTHVAILTEIQANMTSYERLDPEPCIRAYGVDFISNRRHVVLVTKLNNTEQDPPNSVIGTLDWAYDQIENPWVCGADLSPSQPMVLEPWDIADADCNIDIALDAMADNGGHTWFAQHELDYCLSEPVVDECRLQFSLLIMLVVIGCNFTKLLCVLLALMKPNQTLITLGDAIVSFLGRPDPTTRGMCTLALDDIKSGDWPDNPEPRQWSQKRYSRWHGVGQRRWEACCLLSLLVLGALGTLLWVAINTTTTNPDLTTWYDLGFGTVTKSSLVRWPPSHIGRTADLLRNILLANLPQLLLSCLYLTWNRVLTCMAFVNEWRSFFSSRQALRVTKPKGMQRRTRFLTLPWAYVIPMLLASTAVHFLMSQAFFLVAINVYDFDAALDLNSSIISVGFSVFAFIILLGLITILVLVGIGMGYLRYKGGMPLVGVSSAGISAACHPGPEEDGTEVAERGVRWGVICTETGVGHLGFTSGWVGEPIPGRLYA